MIYIFSFFLVCTLGTLTWIDLKTFRLPDILTLPLIGIGIIQGAFFGLGWQASVIGAVVGYAAFVALEIGFRKLRGKNGLGRGDAKLLAAGGAWCGWAGLPFIVLIASGLGLTALIFPSFRKLSDHGKIPFGPFLALAILIVWLAILSSNPEL